MTPRDRRALRLGAMAVGTAVLVFRAIPWAVRAGHREVTRIEMERAMLAETVALIRTAPGMEDSMTHLTRRVASLAARFLLGGSTAEAEADLANRVTAMAERGHLTVDRVVPVADSLRRAGGAVQRVVVQASLTGDLPELLRLLDSLGRGATLLTPASIRLSAGDPSAPVASPEAIKADLTITGWFFVGDTAR